MFHEIKDSLRSLYLEDSRPWLVGFSGGKDSTMLAALVFDAVISVPADERHKPVSVLCTDTRVEIPAIAVAPIFRSRRAGPKAGAMIGVRESVVRIEFRPALRFGRIDAARFSKRA